MTVLTKENAAELGLRVRRLVLFERASIGVGGAGSLSEALGITRRAVHHKLANDRQLTDEDLTLALGAVDKQVAQLQQLAQDLRGIIVDL